MVAEGGVNETGILASFAGLGFTLYYSLFFDFGNTTAFANSTLTNQGTETFGSTTMNVTTYSATNVSLPNGTSYQSIAVKLGRVEGANFQNPD